MYYICKCTYVNNFIKLRCSFWAKYCDFWSKIVMKMMVLLVLGYAFVNFTHSWYLGNKKDNAHDRVHIFIIWILYSAHFGQNIVIFGQKCWRVDDVHIQDDAIFKLSRDGIGVLWPIWQYSNTVWNRWFCGFIRGVGRQQHSLFYVVCWYLGKLPMEIACYIIMKVLNVRTSHYMGCNFSWVLAM